MNETVNITRRAMLATALLAGAAAGARAQGPSTFDTWIASGRQSNFGFHNAVSYPFGKGQLGMPPVGSVVFTGTMLVGTSEQAPASLGLAKSGVFDNLLFDDDFAAVMAQGVVTPAGPMVLRRVATEQSAQLRIKPGAILYPVSAQSWQLQLLHQVELEVPQRKSVRFLVRSETADIRSLMGPDGWTEGEGKHVREAVRKLVPSVLQSVMVELELRKSGKWNEPFPAEQIVSIRLGHWPESVRRFYVPIHENDTYLIVNMVRSRDLGHSLTDTRTVIEKRMLAEYLPNTPP